MMRTLYETAQGLLLESADCCRPNPDTLIPLFSASRDASRLCAPQNRGYSSNYGKSRLAWDCVVVEAASIEPVSGGKFPWAKTRQLSPCQRASWIGSSMHGST